MIMNKNFTQKSPFFITWMTIIRVTEQPISMFCTATAQYGITLQQQIILTLLW